MPKQELISRTVDILDKLPMDKIQEINDFADFILERLDDKTLQDGINQLVQKDKSYQFLEDNEENIYTVEDLKVSYNFFDLSYGFFKPRERQLS